MKIALCYKGITYTDFSEFQRPSEYVDKFADGYIIDFLDYAENHRQCILDPLRAAGHTVDTFITSYYNETHNHKVNSVYQPKMSFYDKRNGSSKFNLTIYAQQYINLFNMIAQQESPYEFYIFSRTEVFYTKRFTNDMFQSDKVGSGFQICWPGSRELAPVSVDDAILVVPHQWLPRFMEYVVHMRNTHMCSHFLMKFIPRTNMLFYDMHDDITLGRMDCIFRHIFRGHLTVQDYLRHTKYSHIEEHIQKSVVEILLKHEERLKHNDKISGI